MIDLFGKQMGWDMSKEEDQTGISFDSDGKRYDIMFCRIKANETICNKCEREKCRMIRLICEREKLGIASACPYILEHLVSGENNDEDRTISRPV